MEQNYETGFSASTMDPHDSNFCGPPRTVGIATYNAHSLNTGRSYLTDLCNDPNIFIIALQEHWLTPVNLSTLNNVHPDFTGHGISAMSDRLCSGVFKGRPNGLFVEKIHSGACRNSER